MACLHPLATYPLGDTEHPLLVPCGKCINCLARLRNEWAFRLSYEQKKSDYTALVTMTYDDDKLPYCFDVNGHPVATLNSDDIRKFIKSYRKKILDFSAKISWKYYICGEYGDKTQRPHYHGIFFFRGISDLVSAAPLASIFTQVWSYQTLTDRIWEQAQTHGAYMYAAKYICKMTDPPSPYSEAGFSLKSQGLGKDYVDDFKDYHIRTRMAYVCGLSNDDPRNMVRLDDGSYTHMPRYLHDKMLRSPHEFTVDHYRDILSLQQKSDRTRYLKAKLKWLNTHPSIDGFDDYYYSDPIQYEQDVLYKYDLIRKKDSF